MGIGKLGPGRYRVFVDEGRDLTGKRIQYTEIVRGTRKDAEARERTLLRERDGGQVFDASRMTVAEFMTKWLDSVQDKVSWNTFRVYEQSARTHIIPDLGHVPLRKLTALQIERAESLWLSEGRRRRRGRGVGAARSEKEPLDPVTVHRFHRVLHTAMARAVKWRLLPFNPVDGVEPPHVPDKEASFLTAEESERLVAALVGHEYELPILVGLYCGLRPAEYLALSWRNVDLDAGELRVTENVIRVRNDHVEKHQGELVRGYRFGPAKTHRSRRPVSIPPSVVDVLKVWKPVQAAQRPRAGQAWTDLGLVFTDARGYPLDLHRVRREFYRVLVGAGLQQVVPYALRHTSATLTLKETKDVKLVAQRLGHANETMVLRVYGHVLPGADREAARRLGELVRRPMQHKCSTSSGEG